MIDINNYKYLFLDRDGVINVERKDDYVKTLSEFVFEEKALQAFDILGKCFDFIFVITNQRGVGRGIMTESSLDNIHQYMVSEISKQGASINKIYYCTDMVSNSINRKPHIGMGFQAQKDFPSIDFRQSIMVGNSKSDIEFGVKLGMYTVLVGNKYTSDNKIYDIADVHYKNLYEFALSLR